MSSIPPVAILLGFSAAGKSTLKREFEGFEKERKLDIRDTDVMIGRDHGLHVYGMFIDLVVGNDRSGALARIECVERDFLRSFVPVKATLIVAGPGVVIRVPEWLRFCARVNPRGFYLVMDEAAVLDGLERRYNKETRIVGQHPSFGSWNQGVTTEYNPTKDRWERIDDVTALANIKTMMRANVPLYEAASCPNDRYVGGAALWGNATVKAEIVKKIRDHLGV